MPEDRRAGGYIDVPYVSQGDDDVGCVWACVKMMIEFYVKSYPNLPNPDVKAVKKGVGYKDDGTPLEGITKINHILRGTKHQLEFSWMDFADFSDVEKELDNQRPVIAWIKQNRASKISHSIVIKGIQKADLLINVNDPNPEEDSKHAISEFMKAWESSDRILIRARITERPTQRKIGDFP